MSAAMPAARNGRQKKTPLSSVLEHLGGVIKKVG